MYLARKMWDQRKAVRTSMEDSLALACEALWTAVWRDLREAEGKRQMAVVGARSTSSVAASVG